MIAIDVMGGDYAPYQILIGALNASKTDIPIILVGPDQFIKDELLRLDPDWQTYPIQIQHASQVIDMDNEPVHNVRQKKDSSIVKMIELVKIGKANIAISAGNSGAVMVAASLILGKEDNIERPAIAGLLPSISGEKILAIDLGANTDCKSKYLYQFAELANKYSQKFIGIKKPRIALLANGQEDSKGSTLTKEAFQLLKQSKLNFIGNVEPFDIFNNKTDVVVCDGFSGNILLKTLEASVEMFAHLLEKDLEHSAHPQLFQIENISKRLASASSGALLLGVKGNVVICHGNSNSQIIEIAIKNYTQFFQ
ncbi:MAG: Phosphate acyltransferase [candidate division TM6 bacterium GW2011_GWF2_37_49]|nr:MAG: Phosphate acyltransferase [candidate division TM6 bacterium GW2011_GWF2_37_49]